MNRYETTEKLNAFETVARLNSIYCSSSQIPISTRVRMNVERRATQIAVGKVTGRKGKGREIYGVKWWTKTCSWKLEKADRSQNGKDTESNISKDTRAAYVGEISRSRA